MRVVFLSPGYPAEMPDFVRGLAEVGAQVIGVGEGPAAALPEKARRALAEYIQVPKLFDEDSLVAHLSAALRGRSLPRAGGVAALGGPGRAWVGAGVGAAGLAAAGATSRGRWRMAPTARGGRDSGTPRRMGLASPAWNPLIGGGRP